MEKLAIAHEYADSIHSSAVMIVQGGKVVDSWGDVSRKITTFSVRKSLLSALYGIYSAQGTIDVNEPLEELGVNDSPDPLTKEERQARGYRSAACSFRYFHPVDFKRRAARLAGAILPERSGFTTIGISMRWEPSSKRRQGRRSGTLSRSVLQSRSACRTSGRMTFTTLEDRPPCIEPTCSR